MKSYDDPNSLAPLSSLHRLSNDPTNTIRRQASLNGLSFSFSPHCFSSSSSFFLSILFRCSIPLVDSQSPLFSPLSLSASIVWVHTPPPLSIPKMTDHHDDDLAAQKTEGFKVGEKKTLQEYQELGKSCSPIALSAPPPLTPALTPISSRSRQGR